MKRKIFLLLILTPLLIAWVTQPPSGWRKSGTKVILQQSTDNVGIGTTNPTQTLDVKGIIRSNNNIITGSGVYYLWANYIRNVDSTYNLTFETSDSGDFIFLTDSNTDFNVGSGKLFVNGNTANVGIGTTAPAAKLDVAGVPKIISFTRDTSIASGTQTVTGLGIRPKGAVFLALQDGTKEVSIGMSDYTMASSAVSFQADSTGWTITANAILDYEGAGTTYAGNISSYDSDGFTISWVKTGSPGGTLTIYALTILN